MAADQPGLRTDQAAERLARDGPNELPSARPRRWWRLVIDVMREPMLLLLFAAGATNFVLAEPLDGSLLMVKVVIIIGISLTQQRKTESALLAAAECCGSRHINGGPHGGPVRMVVRTADR
ncbi:MAG: cation-transporting P-type ATPase [Actinomycetales bacterium]